jgi:hypothetical protein
MITPFKEYEMDGDLTGGYETTEPIDVIETLLETIEALTDRYKKLEQQCGQARTLIASASQILGND